MANIIRQTVPDGAGPKTNVSGSSPTCAVTTTPHWRAAINSKCLRTTWTLFATSPLRCPSTREAPTRLLYSLAGHDKETYREEQEFNRPKAYFQPIENKSTRKSPSLSSLRLSSKFEEIYDILPVCVDEQSASDA